MNTGVKRFPSKRYISKESPSPVARANITEAEEGHHGLTIKIHAIPIKSNVLILDLMYFDAIVNPTNVDIATKIMLNKPCPSFTIYFHNF
jgi:hypothetical protein